MFNSYYEKTQNEVFTPRNDIEGLFYDLSSLILHQGPSTDTGHYISKCFVSKKCERFILFLNFIFLGLCKNKASDSWRLYNDDQAVQEFPHQLDLTEVLHFRLKGFRPYILFYEKRNPINSKNFYFIFFKSLLNLYTLI